MRKTGNPDGKIEGAAPKRRDPAARSLQDGRFHPKVVKSAKAYDRKQQRPDVQEDEET